MNLKKALVKEKKLPFRGKFCLSVEEIIKLEINFAFLMNQLTQVTITNASLND